MIAALDRLALAAMSLLARRRLGPALILAIALLAVLPGQRALPVIDRDEARFVQASRQMLETGDYIDPRNQSAPRYQKPVGIYWLQTAVAALDGRRADAPIHVFRLVSVAGIVLAALATRWGFLPLLGAPAATLAGLMVASAAVTIGEAHIAKTDAALLAVTTLAQAALIRVWLAAREGGTSGARWLFWAMLGLGVLIKGPITPMLAAFTAAAMMARDRSAAVARALAPVRGLALSLVLALPWFVAIGIVSDGAFYAQSFGEDLMAKVGHGAEGHAAPPGYYLLTMWLTFWPWAPFALLALPRLWQDRAGPLATVAAGWILPFWAVFETISTKLPHYTMPVLPAIAALAALAIWPPRPAPPMPPALPLRLAAATLLALGGGALAAVIALGPGLIGERPDTLATILAALAGLVTLGAATATVFGHPPSAALLALPAALLLMPTLVARTLPSLPVLFPAERIAALDARLDACADRPVASLGLTEMSLVVRAGTDTVFPDVDEAAAILAAKNGGRVFVTEADDTLEHRLASALGAPPREIARFDTIDYNRSDRRMQTRAFIHPGDTTLDACLPQRDMR